ncbi:MAG TPA: acylphosphatase [Anaerolineae bacterium]|nr:acylphosphatase [Anaerolineae bacterium]HQH39231.1 acylphosphatase [Anaerolineae bacterium]
MTEGDNAQTAVHIVVHGEVQGVGFRSFVQARALALNIGGWVRNCEEGTVEIWAEGPHDTLQRLIQEVQRGPRHGLVSHLDIEWVPPQNTLGGFHIRW